MWTPLLSSFLLVSLAYYVKFCWISPTIIGPNNAPSLDSAILKLSYKLFQGSHVLDIVYNIGPLKAADIPLPESLQVPKGDLHIPTELGTQIFQLLST